VRCLIGEDTAKRPWVDYEIRKAWMTKRLVVIVHNLSFQRKLKNGNGTKQGSNLTKFQSKNFQLVKCYSPKVQMRTMILKTNRKVDRRWKREAKK
jgi:hypothetical protein